MSGLSANFVAALARDSLMSTTYKPALLKALVRIVRDEPAKVVSLTTIGDAFVRLYWVQTVTFRLRQAPTLQRTPEVVGAIRDAADTEQVHRLEELPPPVRRTLNAKMARILTTNVLTAFHTSKPDGMAPLFTWARGDAFIALTEASLAFLAREAAAVEALANLWWARCLERWNVLAPHVIEKVERNGAERASLAKYLRILRAVDEPACFYCGISLAEVRSVHVDHVIPWSFLLEDFIWDLVLSCAECNRAKSDSLPERGFIDRLFAVNTRRRDHEPLRRAASALLSDDEVARYYEAALSVEWPNGWTPKRGIWML